MELCLTYGAVPGGEKLQGYADADGAWRKIAMRSPGTRYVYVRNSFARARRSHS